MTHIQLPKSPNLGGLLEEGELGETLHLLFNTLERASFEA